MIGIIKKEMSNSIVLKGDEDIYKYNLRNIIKTWNEWKRILAACKVCTKSKTGCKYKGSCSEMKEYPLGILNIKNKIPEFRQEQKAWKSSQPFKPSDSLYNSTQRVLNSFWSYYKKGIGKDNEDRKKRRAEVAAAVNKRQKTTKGGDKSWTEPPKKKETTKKKKKKPWWKPIQPEPQLKF